MPNSPLPSAGRPHGSTVFGLLTDETSGGSGYHGARFIHAGCAQHKVLNFVKWRARVYVDKIAGLTTEPAGTGKIYHGFIGLAQSAGIQNMALGLDAANIFPIADGVGNVGTCLMGFYAENVEGGAPVWQCVVRTPMAGEGCHVIASAVPVAFDDYTELRIERVQTGADAGDLRFYIDDVLVPDGANTYTFDALDVAIPDGVDGDTPPDPLFIGKCHYAEGNVNATSYEDTYDYVDYDVSKFIKSVDAPTWHEEE